MWYEEYPSREEDRLGLSEQSIEGEMRDARTVVWRVPVPANGETKLTATITTGG